MKYLICIMMILTFVGVSIADEFIKFDEWGIFKKEIFTQWGYEPAESIAGYESTISYKFDFPSEYDITRIKVKTELSCRIKARSGGETSKWTRIVKEKDERWVFLVDNKGSKEFNMFVYFENDGHQIYNAKCQAVGVVSSYESNGEIYER